MPSTIVVNGNLGLPSARQIMSYNGSAWSVSNPTMGTAVVSATLTSSSATANGLFLIRNTLPTGSNKNIILDQFVIQQTASPAPTGTLAMHFEFIGETGLVVGTGNVASRTPVNLNPGMLNQPQTAAAVQAFSAGAITIPAAVGTRSTLGRASIETGVTVIHDSFTVVFGADGNFGQPRGGAAARATDPCDFVVATPAIVVAPQTSVWINQYWVTQASNVPSYEYTFSWFEV